MVVLPPVHTAFCRHGGQVNIRSGQQASLRVTQHRVQSVPGAPAGHQSRAAPILLQRRAAVPPRRRQVQVRGQEAAVSRRVRQEDEGQGQEAVGEDTDAEEDEDGPLEASPLSQEGGGVFITCGFGGGGRAGLRVHGGGGGGGGGGGEKTRVKELLVIHQAVLKFEIHPTPPTSCWDALRLFSPFV